MLKNEVEMVKDMVEAAKREVKEYVDAKLKELKKPEQQKAAPKAEPKK